MLKVFRLASSTWSTTKAVLPPENIKQALKTEANHLGFVLFGCSRPDIAADFDRFQDWLEHGYGEGMPYLAQQQARLTRQDPSLLLPGLQTVISLAMPYPLNLADRSTTELPTQGRLASYACLEDYHKTLDTLASRLANQLAEMAPGAKARVCVDTTPILEKAFARKAGLGWIGQNTLLFNDQCGSGLLLAEILTTLELPYDEPLPGDPCANCGLCVEACPTGALLGDRRMDSRRCLSFLTIENRGEIPVQFRQVMGNRVFGCDECQQVCPYNSGAFPSKIPSLLSPRVVPSVDLRTELNLDAQDFKAKYAGTPVLRAKHAGYLRNLIIAAGNSGDLRLLPQLLKLKNEYHDPILQETMDWAVSTLNFPSLAS